MKSLESDVPGLAATPQISRPELSPTSYSSVRLMTSSNMIKSNRTGETEWNTLNIKHKLLCHSWISIYLVNYNNSSSNNHYQQNHKNKSLSNWTEMALCKVKHVQLSIPSLIRMDTQPMCICNIIHNKVPKQSANPIRRRSLSTVQLVKSNAALFSPNSFQWMSNYFHFFIRPSLHYFFSSVHLESSFPFPKTFNPTQLI